MKLFGRDPLLDGARALDGVAGFVEGPRFYPYLSGRKNLELLAAYDRLGAGRAEIDARARHRRAARPREGSRRRLLARHAPAARDRRVAAAQAEAAAARRACDRPRPGWDARHARARPPARRRRDDGRALEPPDERGRGALQPRRDHLERPDHPGEHAARPARERRRPLPARGHRRRPRRRRSARRTASRRRRRTAASSSAPSPDQVATLSIALGKAEIGIYNLVAEGASLERLFLELTDADSSPPAARPAVAEVA